MNDESDGEDTVEDGVNGGDGGRSDERNQGRAEESFERPVVRSVSLGRGGEGRGIVDGALDVGCSVHSVVRAQNERGRGIDERWLAAPTVAARLNGEAPTATARPAEQSQQRQRGVLRLPSRERKITESVEARLPVEKAAWERLAWRSAGSRAR